MKGRKSSKTLSLLGSTGSIGCNVLAIARQFPDRFRVVGLAAGRNIELLAAQTQEFKPLCISVADPALAEPLARRLPASCRPEILVGTEGNCRVASLPEAEMTISAMVGAAGLLPSLTAIRSGKDIGLANKETLVMAGRLMMTEVQRFQVRLLPIDSEHSAIFQALEGGRRQDLARIILTASGGPFRELAAEALAGVSPAQALAHPNWSMGRKISIDSATLMNKGLEVIEARWLFDLSPKQIEVLVHPQSIVHSMVEYQDGSVLAQLGLPDMRVPIAYALSYPERLELGLPRLELDRSADLHFTAPDHQRFPALQLAYAALKAGGVQPAVLNAANEVAVEAFLAGRISFPRITELVARVLEQSSQADDLDLDSILQADSEARRLTEQEIACR